MSGMHSTILDTTFSCTNTDDDRTPVEVPHRNDNNLKGGMRYEDDGEIEGDAPMVRKRARPYGDDSKASGTKTATLHVSRQNGEFGEDGCRRWRGEEKHARTSAKKRLLSRDVEAPKARGRVDLPTVLSSLWKIPRRQASRTRLQAKNFNDLPQKAVEFSGPGYVFACHSMNASQ